MLSISIALFLLSSSLVGAFPHGDNNSERTIQLQLLKVNATKEPFKGSVIFNPGGPGNSGVEEVALKGHTYRDVFGGQFDVIGFDPRGTGRTIPFVCDLGKDSKTSKSLSHRGNSTILPQDDAWSILQSRAWSDGGWFADACYESQKDTGRFLSTAFVARDMLRIVDSLDEDGKLRFWGRSYSTTLGQTFAAMFPDRIDRMLLDSVQIPEDYHSGQWLTSTSGTQASLLNFFSECVNAGPSLCPIANFSGPETTPEDLMDAIAEVFQELRDQPIYLPDSYVSPLPQPWWRLGKRPLLSELKYSILVFLYQPAQFPALSMIISQALARDWTGLTTPRPKVPAPEKWSKGANAFHGIGCADSSFRAKSPNDMYSLVQAELAYSTFADAFMPQVWPCYQWRFQAAEQFQKVFENINTSYPIMFVNGAHDPITPLSGAWKAATAFYGSRLLVHNGHGHGVMNHPSECTIKAIGEYFANGTLPEQGMVCQPDMTGYELLKSADANDVGGDVETRSVRKTSLMEEVYAHARTPSDSGVFGD
ncbi:hypothetical protein EYZ11_005664 [Aspergillus tanneri]|uniref:Uncharacterized protein n=1 Tax=Aspergillus tanneri TaxID=1220188 RepID=A0A4S3JHL3_9EURO|nr:hypothetical protein EYZ11_005664 [Aspergillus tanneri]